MTRGPVYIIEGPDGAGKTTLARALQELWNHHGLREQVGGIGPLVYLHQGPYRDDPLAATVRLLERPDHRGAVVCDRLHLGEQAYGPVYRGRDALGAAGRRMLERYLLVRRSVLIRAQPPFDVAYHNWMTRAAAGGEMFPDEAGFRQVYANFQEARTHLPSVWYDYTATAPASLAFQARLLAAVASYDAGPRVLLVGERPRARGNVHPAAPPFCSRGNASEWLAERLDDANVPERALAWVNARGRVGTRWTPVPPCLLRDDATPYVVALGKVAEAWCLAHRGRVRTFTTVAHPQAHKRFRYHQPYPLIGLLVERLRGRSQEAT